MADDTFEDLWRAKYSPEVETMMKGWAHGSNPSAPTMLSSDEEERFQSDVRAHPWFKEFVAQYGEPPNLEDPEYNYRLAWKSGAMPEVYAGDGRYHWTSSTGDGKSLKSAHHPTAWMNRFMQQFGFDPGVRE